jgi:hypothetical protein
LEQPTSRGLGQTDDVVREARDILSAFEASLPTHWDGRQAILELKDADYQWRQMEWIGWFFEFRACEALRERFGNHPGPTYGKTRFDFQLGNVWDFKAHSAGGSSWTIINDQEAVDFCIRDHGGLGVALAIGTAQYDDARGTFKAWHDTLKGGLSAFERERVGRGAPSRRRKTAFDLRRYLFLWLTRNLIDRGLTRGWIDEFQRDMRNAGGSPRRPKYKIDLDAIPTDAIMIDRSM